MALFKSFRKKNRNRSEGASTETSPGDSAGEPSAGPSPDERAGEPAKGGWVSRIRQGLRKTSQLLRTDIRDLFKREGRLVDDDFLEQVFAALVRTDMGAGPAREIRDEIQREFRGRVVEFDDVLEVIRGKIRAMLEQSDEPIRFAQSPPTVVLVVGVNGSGKTTSIAKLANRLKAEGRGVVLGAADTFRAAAVEQLKVWSERIGVPIVTSEKPGGDPASVAYQAVDRAVREGADVCLIDTAGRLQTKKNLMQELEKIRRVVGKLVPDAPHEVLLVLDATAGQNGISQAEGFSEAARCTGIVLAKLDGTAKGGVIIPIHQRFGLPVKFVGVGEQLPDLAAFDPDAFVDALFADVADEDGASGV